MPRAGLPLKVPGAPQTGRVEYRAPFAGSTRFKAAAPTTQVQSPNHVGPHFLRHMPATSAAAVAGASAAALFTASQDAQGLGKVDLSVM